MCSKNYEVFLKIDRGLQDDSIYKLIEFLGVASNDKFNQTQWKQVGPKLQRKLFSEITAEELELLVEKFRNDLLLFDYSLEAYKKALRS